MRAYTRCIKVISFFITISLILYLFDYLTILKGKRSLPSMGALLEGTYPGDSRSADYWRCMNHSTCIYSAFWDHRFNPSFVRIIGVTSVKTNVSSWKCLLRYNESSFVETSVQLNKTPDSHDMKTTSCFFLCYGKDKPLDVVLITGESRTPPLLVHSTEVKSSSENQLAVCVRPFYGKFPYESLGIAEFVAYYQILGASHFTFYDFKAENSVKRMLDELLKNGISVSLLPWDEQPTVQHAWANAQHSSIADCIYRNSRDFEYVAVVDIDEYIMPKNDITLQELAGKLDKPNSNVSTYLIRNVFFCLEYKDDPSSANLSLPLVTQRKTTRQKGIHPKRKRSKYIVRPAAVTTPGIHFTWSSLKGWSTVDASPSVALLHHYRKGYCNVKERNAGVTERRALRYKQRLLEADAIRVWRTTKKQFF